MVFPIAPYPAIATRSGARSSCCIFDPYELGSAASITLPVNLRDALKADPIRGNRIRSRMAERQRKLKRSGVLLAQLPTRRTRNQLPTGRSVYDPYSLTETIWCPVRDSNPCYSLERAFLFVQTRA